MYSTKTSRLGDAGVIRRPPARRQVIRRMLTGRQAKFSVNWSKISIVDKASLNVNWLKLAKLL